jgi:EAL domain-containing protein (putative c-di-GMP-specific phosphodiesterase class I)
VESHLQLAALTKQGCTHAQGYLFGRPMPIESFVGTALHKFPRTPSLPAQKSGRGK